jgi:DNA repair exonuclease SbcCD ATPase subunit
MRIVKLEAENVKRLRAVSITPDGAVVRIQGANGAGKSSVLDSIAYALGGEKLCPAKPIRRGQDRARVVVELDEDLVVERRWSEGGSKLEVRTKNGLKHPSPQKLLDGLVGRLSFDPLAFLRLKPTEQAETLRALSGVDLSKFDSARALAYQRRTEWNRQVAQLKARLSAMPEIEAPDELVSSADLLAEQERRNGVKGVNARRRAALQEATADVAGWDKRVIAFEDEVAALRKKLAAAEKNVADSKAEAERMRAAIQDTEAEISALVDPDMTEVPGKLREVEAVNERIRQKRARAAIAEELRGSEEQADVLDKEIASIDAGKEKTLAEAKFPVAGLGFADEGVTLEGLPLEQASSAEQLRVSLAMSIALNPKLRVMLIRDGSLLDEKSLAAVAAMAEQNDCQVWLEMVAPGATCGVVIEDGAVVGAEEKAPAPEAVSA